MITQALYPINPPCLYVTVISIYRKKKFELFPADQYLLKFNNRNISARHEKCSKLNIKTSEWLQWYRPDIFVVNFERNSQLVLVLSLLTVNR